MSNAVTAYYSTRPLGRLAYFLLAIPLGMIDRMVEVADLSAVSWEIVIAGLLVLHLVLANIRRNRVLDLGWGRVGVAFAVAPPIMLLVTSFMEGFTRGNPDEHVLWAGANAVILIIMYATHFAFVFAPGEQARAAKALKNSLKASKLQTVTA